MASGVLFVHSLSSEFFGNHVSDDTKHGSTSVVEFNIQLAGFFLGVLDIISEVSNTVVTVVLGSRHPCKLNKSEEQKDLCETGGGDGEESSNSSWNIGELQVVGRRNVSIEDDVVVVHDGTDNSGHGNTSVLAFDGTTTFEGLRLSFEPSERIVNAKGLGDTKFCMIQYKLKMGVRI